MLYDNHIANNLKKCKMSNIVMKMSEPLTLIIFGATGDLYQNKLAVALFDLFSLNLLPKEFKIIGFARKSLTDLEFQDFTKDAVSQKHDKYNKNYNQESLDDFLKHLQYIQGDLENLENFKDLNRQLVLNDKKQGICTNKLFYLAVPPSLYEVIFKNISKAGLTVPCTPNENKRKKTWTRVLVEKPFGKDIQEAKRLDKMLGELFDESQIFRIDHYLAYLAKGVVDKILNFRFGPGETESRWNNKNVQNVRIIFHEKDLVGKGGAFYDSLGAFRDVGQSHMLQMLALVAMENPSDKSSGGIHQARQRVLEKIKLSEEDKMVRGQYEGYLEELGVQPNSTTETFFRLNLFVDNPKWKGVPFVLEFGKALDKSEVFIEACFKESKTCLNFPISNEDTLRDAYEKVFYDCLLGDQTIFASTGEIIAEWVLATDIIEKWQSTSLVIYKKGSKGVDIK